MQEKYTYRQCYPNFNAGQIRIGFLDWKSTVLFCNTSYVYIYIYSATRILQTAGIGWICHQDGRKVDKEQERQLKMICLMVVVVVTGQHSLRTFLSKNPRPNWQKFNIKSGTAYWIPCQLHSAVQSENISNPKWSRSWQSSLVSLPSAVRLLGHSKVSPIPRPFVGH